jgi:hypothetical protein
MTFANITRGKLDVPIRAMVTGLEGVGKSTFAAGAPSPIFLGVDGGTEHLNIDRLPEPKTWQEVLDGVDLLEKEKHDYKTLVVDTLNWAEALCHLHVTGGKVSIDEYKKGFGKGRSAALDQMRVLQKGIERCWSKGMNVLLISHVEAKTIENPLGSDYKKYVPAMDHRAAGLFAQWVSYIGFIAIEEVVRVTEQQKYKSQSSGARFLYTAPSASYMSKFRGAGVPPLPLSWRAFEEAVKGEAERHKRMSADLDALLTELAEPETETKVREWLTHPNADIAEAVNAVKAKLNEKQNNEPENDSHE